MSESKRTKTFDKTDKREESQAITKSDETEIMANCSGDSGLRIEILPPELWEETFKKLDNSKDLVNCWNMANLWKKALRSTDFYFKMTLPWVRPYLSTNDLVQCSSVSKSWSATIDSCMRHLNDYQIGVRLSFNDMSPYKSQLLANLKSQKKVGVANPVVFRRLLAQMMFHPTEYYRQPPTEPESRIHDPLTHDRSHLHRFLDQYGHLIYHLQLTISGERVTYLDKLKLIHSCLERTPNLRVLHIDARRPGMFINVLDENETPEQLEAFDAFISENPWPALEHLQALQFSHATRRQEFASIANAYAAQLVSLRFGLKLLEPNRVPSTFPCLKEIGYFYSEACSAEDFGAFIRSSECPLENLKVTFVEDPDEKNCTDLTTAVNAASESLSTLVIIAMCPNMAGFNSDITKFERLRLPKLKKLDVRKYGYPPLEFLRSVCPSLEQLIATPFPYLGSKKAQKPGSMYSELYSIHEFWSGLRHIQNVDVEGMVYWDGDAIKRRILKGKIMKMRYTRKGYAETGKDSDTGINTNTQAIWEELMDLSSSEEDQ